MHLMFGQHLEGPQSLLKNQSQQTFLETLHPVTSIVKLTAFQKKVHHKDSKRWWSICGHSTANSACGLMVSCIDQELVHWSTKTTLQKAEGRHLPTCVKGGHLQRGSIKGKQSGLFMRPAFMKVKAYL